jgi:hypothetical protein
VNRFFHLSDNHFGPEQQGILPKHEAVRSELMVRPERFELPAFWFVGKGS